MANKRMAKKAAKKAEMKTVEANKVTPKKVEPKTIEIKPLEKVEEVVEVVEETVTVAEEAVETVKEEKPKAKRTRKAKIKTSIVVQAFDREVSMEEAIERATEDWCKSGNDRADLKEIAVYVKTEEAAIFYVINGKATGRVEF